jgi:hypothetical protein
VAFKLVNATICVCWCYGFGCVKCCVWSIGMEYNLRLLFRKRLVILNIIVL